MLTQNRHSENDAGSENIPARCPGCNIDGCPVALGKCEGSAGMLSIQTTCPLGKVFFFPITSRQAGRIFALPALEKTSCAKMLVFSPVVAMQNLTVARELVSFTAATTLPRRDFK